jgi:phosphoglycolate phosphatase-like HAD superfamily hydrolase
MTRAVLFDVDGTLVDSVDARARASAAAFAVAGYNIPVEAALATAGVEPADAVMVGDTRYDIEAAHRAGVPCVALLCGGADPATLAGAEAIYRDPAELTESLNAPPFAWASASSIAV